jgi:hypothetical protein
MHVQAALIGSVFGDRVFKQPVLNPVIGDTRVMDETTEKQAPERMPDPVQRKNRGWFRTEDKRINREGRRIPESSRYSATVKLSDL